MAESNQRRVADPFDISDEDPFAELTRIMGFDPRVPVGKQPKENLPSPANQDTASIAQTAPLVVPPAKPMAFAVATPVAPKLVEPAPAAPASEAHDDFGIDLEKELLGEFADFEPSREEEPVVAKPAVAFEAPAEPSAKTVDIAAADPFDGDFEDVFAEALTKETPAAEAAPAPAAPVVEAVMPQLAPQDRAADYAHDDLAADFDFGELDLNDPAFDAAPAVAEKLAAPAVSFAKQQPEPDFDFSDVDLFELSPEATPAEQPAAPVAARQPEPDFDLGDIDLSEPLSEATPAEQPAAQQAEPEPDFDLGDIDLFGPSSEAIAAEQPAAPAAVQQPKPVVARDALPDDAMAEVDMDFSAAFDEQFAAEERGESPASDPFALDHNELMPDTAPPVNQAPEPVAAKPAAPVELSLEDELKALLAAARGELKAAAPVVIDTPPVVEPARAQYRADPRWAALEADDEDEPAQGAAQAAPAVAAGAAADYRRPFADPALTARHANYQASASKPVAGPPDEVDDLDALIDAMEHEVHAVDQPVQAKAEPEPQHELGGSPAAAPAATDYVYEQAEQESATHSFAGYGEDAPSATYDAAPEIETVDVPEAAVAVADDIDIPELAYEEDKPKAPAYDDIDADFAAAFEDNNLNEEPVNQVVRGVARPTERANFDADFEALYGPAYVNGNQPAAFAGTAQDFQPSAAGYRYDLQGEDAFDPIEQPAAASRDRFVDLDFGTDVDEEPASSLAAQTVREERRPRRSLLIAAVVGGVALLGGVGALALTFGSGDGNDTPVVVKADDSPVKVKPENPGGTVVPNQDNKVYDAVKGTAAAAETPVQDKLVTTSEEPVDVASVAENDPLPGVNLEDDVIPKTEDRVDPAASAEESAPADEGVVVAPRKVKTMVVRSDGTLVPHEDSAPAAGTTMTAEAPAAPAAADETGAVAPDKKAAGETVPVKKVETKKVETKKVVAEADSTTETSSLPPANTTDQPAAPKIEKVAAPKTEQVAAVEPAAVATGAWSVQIASQPSAESAKSTYEDLAKRYANVIGGKGVNIVKAEIAGKGTYWRVRVPAQTRDEAVKLCTDYKAAGGNCFISK